MTVYVAEIKGRGIAAFHADTGSDAERVVRDRVFRDEMHRYIGGILNGLDCPPVIVGGVVLAIGLLLLQKARSDLSAQNLAVHRTAANLRKDLNLVKGHVS